MAISLNTLHQNYNYVASTHQNADHEYFNMSTINQYTDANTQPQPLRFSQTKQFNIVGKASDYYLSIIRWNLQSNLPVLIPDIQIKSTPQNFTNLTDYELALLYTTETTDTVPDTFGLVSIDGSNFNGNYFNGEFGLNKQYKINFPPDNSNCVTYDNYNNGLTSNGSINGSIYIISNGVLKVFDKVSSTLIYTLTPPSGITYQFICADKTLGNFYIGVTNNTDNTIYYKEYTRATGSTWTAGGSYTSFSEKQKVAGICLIGSNIYEFSYNETLPDTLYAVNPTNSEVYNVNTNTQYTQYPTKSSITITKNTAYGIGDDGYTYAIPYPNTNLPVAWQGPVNNATLLKYGCMWSSQQSNELYAMSQNNQYDVWNFKNSPNATVYNNDWTSVGEIDINYPTITAISIDKQPSTNKLLAVGSDNNLYVTNDPVAPIEYIYSSGDPSYADYNYGLSMWNQSTGNQNTYEIHNFNNLFGNHTQLFKHQNRIFVPEYQGSTTNVNLVIYSVKDFSVLSTQTNFSTDGVTNMCQLPLASKFIYSDNNNNMKIHNISTYALLETNSYFATLGELPSQFYEVDATHYAVCLGNNQVYIFQYGTVNPILNFTTPSNCIDICVSTSDVTNGANSLFCLCGNDGFGNANQIYKYTFTNNTYTAINTEVLIYQEPTAGKYITFIDYQQDQQALVFISSTVNLSTYTYSNKVFHSLFFSENYNINKMTSCNISLGNNLDIYAPNKVSFYLCQSTMSTRRWTQVTSNIQVKAVSVSQSNPNNLYCISSTNSKIYNGQLVGNNITFSQYNFITQTYNYLSNSPLTSSDTLNLISEWNATGNPSSINIFDESITQSTIINKPSFMTNGTNLYALYDNLNNQTKLNLINPTTLTSTTSVIIDNTIKNGLIGLDENNNILVSTLNNSISYLQGFNPLTLSSLYNNQDPIADYNSSSVLIYPYVKTVTTTHYNLASDGCINLLFIPETINTDYASLLNYPQSKEEIYANPYFYIKYVDTFCRMINDAIDEAFKTINGATWAHLPYFEWNSVEGKLVYNQPLSNPVVPNVPTNAKWFISVNQPLFSLLNTFRFKFFAKNAGNSAIYPEDLECRYLLDTNILFDGTAQSSGEYVSYIQQISSVQTWSPIVSFVFCSTILPIENQITGQPQNLNSIDPSLSDSIIAQSNQQKVLTDFITPLTTGVEQTNQIIYYIPQGEYRLVDLIGNTSLQQLSLEVYWKDKLSTLHPLTLDAGASSDLLCMLRRKTYNY